MIHEATFPAGVRSGLWPAALLLGTLSFLAIGFLMATVAPNARAAQIIGMILFFPMWLLSGGRTAPDVMGETMRRTPTRCPSPTSPSVSGFLVGIGNGPELLVLGVALLVARSDHARLARLVLSD